MATLKTHRLFISHAWQYSDDYYRMVNLLDGVSRFAWHNYSVPKHDPVVARGNAALKKELSDQIRPVGIIVVLAGMYTAYSQWMQYEIDRAKGWGKPIIGVVPWGGRRTPRAVSTTVDEMVRWNGKSVAKAIRQFHS